MYCFLWGAIQLETIYQSSLRVPILLIVSLFKKRRIFAREGTRTPTPKRHKHLKLACLPIPPPERSCNDRMRKEFWESRNLRSNQFVFLSSLFIRWVDLNFFRMKYDIPVTFGISEDSRTKD